MENATSGIRRRKPGYSMKRQYAGGRVRWTALYRDGSGRYLSAGRAPALCRSEVRCAGLGVCGVAG